MTEERDPDRFPRPDKDSFSLQLFSPVSWEPIPGTKTPLEDWERCTGAKHLYLSSEGLHSGQRGYIVLSTSYCYGEDVTPRGYIRIYDVIEVIPEPGQPLTKNKVGLKKKPLNFANLNWICSIRRSRQCTTRSRRAPSRP